MLKTINSPSNPYIKHLVKIRKDRKYRILKKQALIVGEKACLDIQKTKISIDTFITTNKSKKAKAKKNIFVTDSIMKKITNVKTPEEIAIVIDIPKIASKKFNKVLILDKISDPGNLGTIIRSANAFNFDFIVFSDNCVDPYNEKVIRASKATIFFIPHDILSPQNIKSFIKKHKLNNYLADIKGENISNIKLKKPLSLIACNESQGPSFWTKNLATNITIPIKKDMDSLNVAIATSIIMFKISCI